MQRITSLAIIAAGWLAVCHAPSAAAQGPYVPPQVNPNPHPAVSPYLNLFRGGSPGINYYAVVRPQLQFTRSLQQLQQAQLRDAENLSALSGSLTNPGVSVTGIRAGYMNFSHYYGTRITNSATLPLATVPPAVVPPLNLYGTPRQ